MSILSDVAEFVKRFIELKDKVPPEALAVVVAGSALAGFAAGWYWNSFRARNPSKAMHEEIEALQKEVRNYRELRTVLLGDEGEVWRFRETERPKFFEDRMKDRRPVVITVANLKGGVGKTTLVAGLAAHFAVERRKRVLAIDFDYQGSLTRTMLLAAGASLDGGILADDLLDGTRDGKWVTQAKDLGGILPEACLITSGQVFDAFENKLSLTWLLRETKDDIRFRLATLLLSDEVRRRFDIVLIDAPPRLSTGAINALCASHAVLIPTVLDRLSADAVGNFAIRANSLRGLNPSLHFAGVIGTLTERAQLRPDEQEALAVAEAGLAHWQGARHVFVNRLRRSTLVSRVAGAQIPYLRDRRIKTLFDRLGGEVAERVGV